MSRIIVKNIPDYLDEGRLKQHIGAHSGNKITDVKIVRRPDGTSRRFGFIGFKEENDAFEAQKYFDKTFIDTSKINVGIAKAFNDEELQQQKQFRRGQGQKSTGVVTVTGKNDEAKKQKQPSSSKSISFEEFMEVMKPRSKRKISGMEDADAGLNPEDFVEKVEQPKERKSEKNKKQKIGTNKTEEQSNEEEETPLPDATVNDEGLTDLEYMYKRMKRKVGAELEEAENEDKAFEQSDEEEEKGATDSVQDADVEDEMEAKRQERKRIAMEKKAKKDEEDTDSIMESGRLFIRNLSFETTEEDLEEHFSRFGQVEQAHIPLDKFTKKAKGIAFVKFIDPSQALSAFRAVDGHTFQGRLLHVLPAAQKGESASDATTTLKGKKKQEMKTNAMKDFNWNTLYMNSDAVASSVAARLGLDKSDILNPQQGGDQDASISPAVRLALAETSVINETRDFLESEGINVDAFETSASNKRSDRIILVKNIPFGTSADVLQGMFEKHGAVERTIMPPSGTIAIVEMQVPGEAKVAFRSLAYKRLGNSVLYLEKAPIGIMTGKLSEKKSSDKEVEDKESAPTITSTTEAASGEATLYVKNLSFSTTDERLASAFGKMPDVTFVRIQKRSVKQRDGKGEVKLSMGFGFVGFRSTESARIAQKMMDKTTLDGHVLSVSVSKRGHDADDDAMAANGDRTLDDQTNTAPSTKLIVKNLAFQATKKEVRALFAAHGKLKSVRVPRKALSSGGGAASGVRGFGFVEFVNKVEALNAYRALRHSHLLGRHLVLEWDVEGNNSVSGKDQVNSIEKLRQKAASQANTSQGLGMANKREKLRLNEEDIRKAALDERRRAVEEDNEDDEDDDEEE